MATAPPLMGERATAENVQCTMPAGEPANSSKPHRVVRPADAWAAERAVFPNYEFGSDGPKTAEALLADDGGRSWRPVHQPVEWKA